MIDYTIQHQSEASLFYIHLDDGQRAFLKYSLSGTESANPTIDIYSTFVPDAYRGNAFAGALVDHAFTWADDNGLHIKTSCWYAAKKMERRLAHVK